MAVERRCHGLAFSGGGIYAVGGLHNNNYAFVPLSAVELFSEDTCSLRTVSQMQTGRMEHATASLDGFIYVSGGLADGYHNLMTVERYDPEEDSWTFVAPMLETRKEHGMTALKGSLYAIGGYENKSSGERYDARRDKWYSEARLTLTKGRQYFGLTSLDGCLYAVGGFSNGTSAERFDPRDGHWASLPDMSHEKRVAASASIGGHVAVIGCSASGLSMELFNPIANRWQQATTPSGIRVASGFAVAWAPWSPDSLITNSNA